MWFIFLCAVKIFTMISFIKLLIETLGLLWDVICICFYIPFFIFLFVSDVTLVQQILLRFRYQDYSKFFIEGHVSSTISFTNCSLCFSGSSFRRFMNFEPFYLYLNFLYIVLTCFMSFANLGPYLQFENLRAPPSDGVIFGKISVVFEEIQGFSTYVCWKCKHICWKYEEICWKYGNIICDLEKF